MVFSVQQGEHGPLVVYKLKLPDQTAPQAPSRATMPPAAAVPAQRPGPLQPTVLGTVSLPAERAAALGRAPAGPAPAASDSVPAPAAAAAPVPLTVPDAAAVQRIVSEYDSGGQSMVNATTGERITLEAVNDEVLWRRDTAEKLRDQPFAPRF